MVLLAPVIVNDWFSLAIFFQVVLDVVYAETGCETKKPNANASGGIILFKSRIFLLV